MLNSLFRLSAVRVASAFRTVLHEAVSIISGTKDRWSHRLVKNVKTWLDRKHGNMDFYMTQFLTGHGYLHKYGHKDGEVSSFYGNTSENALHIFLLPEIQRCLALSGRI